MILRAFFIMMILLTSFRMYAVTVVVRTGDGGNYFTPSSFTINPGDTVKWVWVSGHHNTSSVSFPAGAAAWYSNLDNGTTSFFYVPAVSGLYKYTCTHHSGMDGQFFVTGCSYPLKPIITKLSSPSSCEGDTQLLVTTLQAGASYQWLDGMTAITGANSDTLRVLHSGNYKVIVNRCGVDSISDPFTLVIDSLPKPSFSYSDSLLSYTFTNTTSQLSNHTYVWDFGDGSLVQTTVHPVHVFPNIGVFKVTLEAINTSTYCSDTIMQEIHIPMGIKDLNGYQYSISPNPAASYINLNISVNAISSLTDQCGRIIKVPVIPINKGYMLDVRALPAGMYFLHVATPYGTGVEKIIITR